MTLRAGNEGCDLIHITWKALNVIFESTEAGKACRTDHLKEFLGAVLPGILAGNKLFQDRAFVTDVHRADLAAFLCGPAGGTSGRSRCPAA